MIDRVMGAGSEQRVDYLVAGAGIAGLRAAIEFAPWGTVLVLTKNDSSESIWRYHSSGASRSIADDEDELTVRVHETLRSGDGLCREDAVEILSEAGPGEIRHLAEWGARLETKGTGTHHVASGPRRLRPPHAEGTTGGMEILRALLAKVKTLPSVEIRSSAVVADLLLEDGKVSGACYLDERSSALTTVRARAVLLATGGLGQVYAKTTDPADACGDGVAMAYRVGALLADLEFIQFHPTVLSTTLACLALSAALREKGAALRNLELDRFMVRYHEAGELAPPDVLARAIVSEMQRRRSNFVYLDLTGLDAEQIRRDFPRLCAGCLESNIDITSDLIPTHPAAHFSLGGVATSLEGSTTVAGLYAAGEVAATGVHGANHFGNNSLLESLVFAGRAARAALHGAGAIRFPAPPSTKNTLKRDTNPASAAEAQTPAAAVEIRRLMWEMAGVIRRADKLKEALSRLGAMRAAHPHPPNRGSLQLQNMLEVARLLTECALARKESRGTHYRADYPLRNDSEPPRHSYVSKQTGVYFQ